MWANTFEARSEAVGTPSFLLLHIRIKFYFSNILESEKIEALQPGTA